MSRIQELKEEAYEKLLKDLETKGFGTTSSRLISEEQLEYFKSRYLVARTPKTLGELGRPYLICKC